MKPKKLRQRRTNWLAARVRGVLRANERGAALPMVLVIFIVGFALVTAFLVAIIGSAQVSQATRAHIQAQAAAEAGIAAAQVKLPELSESGVNICTPFPAEQLASDTEPRFQVTGVCDLSAESATLMLTSEGESATGSTAVVQAVFALQTPGPAGDDGDESPVTGDSEAIVSSGAFGTHPGLTLQSGDGVPTRVITREATFTCNGVTVPGGLLAAGNVTTTPCVVNGDLHIGGLLTTNDSGQNVVRGDLRLAGSGIQGSRPAVSHKLSGSMGDPASIGRYNVYANGNVQLHNVDTTVYGDLIVAGSGTSNITGTVKRNLFTNGTAEITGVVEGEVTALGTERLKITGTVGGDVFTNGTVEVTGTVDGNIEARGTDELIVSGVVKGNIRTDGTVLLRSGSRVEGNIVALGQGVNTFHTAPEGNVQVAGALNVDGWHLTFPGFVQAGTTVTFNNTKVQGTRPDTDCNVTRGSDTGNPWSQGATEKEHRVCDDVVFPTFSSIRTVNPVSQVEPPVIEPARDYEYAADDWLGFSEQTVTGSACNDWKSHPGKGWGSISDLTTNTVIDLRACGKVQFSSWSGENAKPKLGVDVALIVDSAGLNGLTWSAKPGTTPSLWLVRPGTIGSAAACERNANIDLERVTIDKAVRTMIYSSGATRLSNTTFTGSVYSGSVCVGGASTVTFSPTEFPGWGATPGGTGGSNPGDGSGSGGGPQLSVPQIIGGISASPLSLRNVDGEPTA